jgi:hypothetical protein
MQISPPIRTGDLVRIRRRSWRVVDVRAEDACCVFTVVAIGSANGGVTRRFIAPFDRLEPHERPSRLRLVTRRRWRRACRALLANNTPPGALQHARYARIDVLPHQLTPALAVVRGLGSRLLLADDVGLGKTIQAALVLAELRARGVAERALVVTPAGLRDQWAAELAHRFDLGATVVDAREMRRRLATLPVGVNPWSTMSLAIASADYVKRQETLPSVNSCRWDVLIVDEAHAMAGDSDRHHAVAAIARRSTYVLLLTATPHNGDPTAFLSLCGIGTHGDPLLLFRRTRADIRPGAGRRVRHLYVRPSDAERRMHAAIARLARAIRDEATGSDTRDGVWLALAVLNKRALSSARSLQRTVERRLTALNGGADAAPRQQLTLPLFDPDADTDDADRPPDLAGLGLADPSREPR